MFCMDMDNPTKLSFSMGQMCESEVERLCVVLDSSWIAGDYLRDF